MVSSASDSAARPKKVVSVSLGPSRLDYEFECQLWGRRFHVRRVGTDGNTNEARRLVREHDGQVDCIALGGMAISFRVGDRSWKHRETMRIAAAARTTPVVGGRAMKRIVDRWAVREIARRQPELFAEKNVLFLSGIANWDLVEVMGEFTDKLVFADPILHYGVPTVLPNLDALKLYARVAMPLLTRRPYVSFFPRTKAAEGIQHRELARFFQRADVVVGDLSSVLAHAPLDLHNKIIVTDSIDPEALEIFRDRGVTEVCTTTPEVFATEARADLQVLHAAAVAHLEKDPADIDDGDYLELLSQLDARPRTIHPRGEVKRVHKFAYLYYPSDRRALFRDPRVRWLRSMPEDVQALAERAVGRLPIWAHGHVRGVQSPTGDEAEGWILYLPVTAERIRNKGDAYARRRVREAAQLASKLGVDILGVGGFAREIPLATERVAAEVSLPLTSGASYLISVDMWAAKLATLAMGVDQDEVGRVMGTALVIGADDAMGAVAAELLALVFRRVVLVGREPDRLLELCDRLRERSAHCTVEVDTKPGDYLPEAVLVVTGMSPGWRGAIDLDALRTGAVLCDCERPSEFTVAVADVRPDVLFVRAGEIELPGPADLGAHLGPPPKVAYASMAEVVILALEGRYECFSVGTDIQLDRVKEIYKLGLRHGMRLAGLRGLRGPLTESEIRLARERAGVRSRDEEMPPPLETTAVETIDEELPSAAST